MPIRKCWIVIFSDVKPYRKTEMKTMTFDKDEMKDKQKRESLFNMQKETLDSFLERGAISKEQYEKSLTTLKEKMNMN